MILDFDLDQVQEDATEFVVAEGRGKTPKFGYVLTDRSVRQALAAAAVSTLKEMRTQREEPELYDPSNSYSNVDYLYLPLGDFLAVKAHYIHTGTSNSEMISNPIKVLPKISMYAARMLDRDGKSLTAVKSTSNFGRTLEKGLWALLSNQELRLVDEPKFQLSNDFDFLIDSTYVHIYRHSAFESACGLHAAIREAASINVEYARQHIDFVDFSSIEVTGAKSMRSARVLSAIRAKDYGKDLDQELVLSLCKECGIAYSDQNGKICVDDAHHLTFLRLIARQLLEIEMRKGHKERFYASNRREM